MSTESKKSFKMSTELYFIYDTHCPWSYATTSIVTEIQAAFPQITLQLLNNAYYDGESQVSNETINNIKALSNIEFGESYIKTLTEYKDSTLCSNLMTWVQNKSPNAAFDLLKEIQHQHFVLGSSCTTKEQVAAAITALKLSPPAKSLQNERLTKDAEFVVHEITELQELIGTAAIPALLLAVGDNLILLNHNLYIEKPQEIVKAIELELKNQH